MEFRLKILGFKEVDMGGGNVAPLDNKMKLSKKVILSVKSRCVRIAIILRLRMVSPSLPKMEKKRINSEQVLL